MGDNDELDDLPLPPLPPGISMPPPPPPPPLAESSIEDDEDHDDCDDDDAGDIEEPPGQVDHHGNALRITHRADSSRTGTTPRIQFPVRKHLRRN